MGAHIQNQGVYSLCKPVRRGRCGALRGSARRRTRVDWRGPGRRSDQAANRATQPGKIGRISDVDRIQEAQTGLLHSHGFAKNEKDNVADAELAALKKLAAALLAYDDKSIARAIASGTLVEVNCEEKTIQ
jgi:hypothetical protein